MVRPRPRNGSRDWSHWGKATALVVMGKRSELDWWRTGARAQSSLARRGGARILRHQWQELAAFSTFFRRIEVTLAADLACRLNVLLL